MTLVDPKGGVPYGTGDRLPSAHVNTVWAQQPNAVDGVGGGTYTPSAVVSINDFAGNVKVGQSLQWDGTTKTHLPQVAARPYHFAVPLTPASNVDLWAFTAPQFGGTINNDDYQWRQTAVATPLDPIVFAIPYPSYETGLTLRGVRVHLTGASVDGHSGTPSVGVKGSAADIEMPQIKLISKSTGGTSIGGLTTVLDTVNDPSGSLGAYEDRHIIDTEIDGGGALTDNPLVSGTTGKQYFVAIFGENGTGSEVNEVAVFQIESFWNVTRIGP